MACRGQEPVCSPFSSYMQSHCCIMGGHIQWCSGAAPDSLLGAPLVIGVQTWDLLPANLLGISPGPLFSSLLSTAVDVFSGSLFQQAQEPPRGQHTHAPGTCSLVGEWADSSQGEVETVAIGDSGAALFPAVPRLPRAETAPRPVPACPGRECCPPAPCFVFCRGTGTLPV